MRVKVVVALRKESVDRNISEDVSYSIIVKSLSARRAWIEMGLRLMACLMTYVALRKESVDRNVSSDVAVVPAERRSPQGERG